MQHHYAPDFDLASMPDPADIQNWIEAGLPGAKARVEGDGRHFEAVVIAADFSGKPLVERHQMVYRALGDKMREEIHALTMKTLTPEEQAEAK
ncbi:MAG: BolA/IbaG family iron-sulfur metabolism protein [Gammaproteobacteria bacterium]|nr:BolA/IbaG family iron-sulfur metabolism protein [Gammaproteobacteria bacterium]CAJ2377412.1 MAG: Cell division protein BolA [Arenicellales bacterium IbO2]MDA7967776.1 BolA/IbaG family iron-sulfur metabolism protein [Gammaproteobacteria bacterium]MDA7970135.1 BolA/IbaG family iron-sulfur metabolism protein [Gammaproteobacteria bacterium]MDA7972266.1 BolA/IbaG family iron-sulfur metabolism protein [Gammaproteobacteria bacterium]